MKPSVQSDQMPSPKYNTRNPTRVERLLRERELRKSSRAFSSVDSEFTGPGGNSVGNGDGGGGGVDQELLLDNEMRSIEALLNEEAPVVGSTSAAVVGDGCEGGEGRPLKQRLLVVANRSGL